jgi:tetratricopeptide (TPR) repeat protein
MAHLKSERRNVKSGCYNPPVLSEIQRRSAHASDDVGAASGSDGDAKVEQLLLAGLDHYFEAHYERAIAVWTRALFLDRNHARVRAYIERARSALAEQQRQSEELLHNGVAAFHRGEGAEARRLLQAAIEGGAPLDEALTVLERLDLASPAATPPAETLAPRARRNAGLQDREVGAPRQRRRAAGILGIAGAMALLAVAGYGLLAGEPDWQLAFPFFTSAEPSSAAPGASIPQDLSLPLPQRGEMALARGRALIAGGRLHEALSVLDQVRPTDPQKPEADRLRAAVQQQLLALTPMPPPLAGAERRLP